jgi:hypothetical protein
MPLIRRITALADIAPHLGRREQAAAHPGLFMSIRLQWAGNRVRALRVDTLGG